MRFFGAVSAVIAGLFLAAAGVVAQPQIPATFFGSVTVDGKPAESGLEVRGLVDGVDCTQAALGERPVIRDGASTAYVLYVVHESQRPGCARDGSTVTFTVGGQPAVQKATWKPGPTRLDLSTGSAPPIPLPSATATVPSASTAGGTPDSPASATQVTRPSGTPPTDDVQLPGLNPSQAAEPSLTEADSGGGSSVFVVVIVGVGVLGLAGGAAGIVLSRRQRRGNSADDS